MKKYVFGFISGICLLPILDSLTELLQVVLEIPKGKLSKCVIKINNEIQDIQAQSEPITTNCIGFEIPDEVYLDDDEEEDCKQKNKIGF